MPLDLTCQTRNTASASTLKGTGNTSGIRITSSTITQWMNQRDPNYVQMTYQLRDLKLQLDAAWHAFSSRCIYFPDPNRP